MTFEGHRDRVVAVAFSSDGNTVASVASDEPLRLWNSTTGEEIGKSSINMEPIFSGSLSFSGDGQRLLYWDQFRLVVFEIADLRPALQLEGSSGGYFQAACFDASGGQLAIAQDGSNLRIVNILDGATVRELQHPGGTVRCMALSRSPEQLAVWSTDNRIRIWEPTAGKPLRGFEVGPIKQLMFTHEDRWLCGVTDQRTIKTWDAQEWRELSVRPALSSSDSLRTGYAFSNDGNRIASQQQIRLETESGERSILTSDHSTTAVFSPDSQLLAIGGLFGNIELWTVSPLSLQSKLENVHKHKIVMLDFSPDGTLLASASEDGTVCVRTTEDWTEIMRFREHRGALRHLAFAPNGETIVTASDDAEIFVWKPKTGEITLRLDHLGSVPETVGFDRTEKILLAWFTNAVVRAWNYPAGDERYTVGEASAITWGDPREGLRFNPQSGEFAYVEQHSLIALARVNDGSTIRKLGGGLISGFDFAPREPRIAAGQYGSSLEIFDLDSRELLKLQSPGIGSRPRFSPDGSYLACTGQTGAWLWNGTAQPESKDARNSINVDLNAITFDPAHSRITTVGREGVISSWNTTDGQTLSEWIGHSRQGSLAVLSPDGTSEAYLHWDQHGTKLRWNDAGKPDVSLTPAFVPAKSAAISADGTLLAVLPESGKDRQFLIPIGPPSNEIELWDVRSGTRRRVLRGHATNIETVGFSHHGQQLVSRGTNGQILIWDTETGEHVREFRPPNRLVSHRTFSISADDELIAFPCANDRDHLEFGFQAVSVQKVKTGEQVDLVRFKRSNFFRTFDVQHVKMFSSDHRLMMVSDVGEASQYDMQTKEVTSLLDPMGVSCLAAAFSHDGKRVAIADGDQSISIWNLESRRLEMRFNSHFNMLQTVAWSPDDTTVISGDVTGTTFWWRIDTGEIQRRVLGNRRTVKSAVYSPDGLLLATGGDDSTIRIWDVAQQHELKLLEGHSDWVTGLAIHPDGKLLASASRDQTVRLWSFPSGEPRGVLRGHTDTVRRVKFSPDGSQLASSGRDGELRFWNIDAHTCRLTVSSRMGDLHGLCWSPDSKSLATGAYNGQLAVWNAAGGDLLLATEETEDFLRDVAYSPNGRWLASVGDEGLVRMRLAENGATGLTLYGLPRDGTAVGFSPDGKDLYACAGTSLRTWKLPDDALLRPTGLPPSAATTLSARARIAFDAGNYNQAEQEFLVAAAESPDNPMWPWWRGITLTYLSRHRDALVPYDQAVALRGDDRLNPNRNADILFYRGVLKQQLKDAHGAIADFDEAIRLKPQIWSAYNRRGLAYEAQQKFAEALEDFNVAIEHVPEDATYVANRANLHQKMGAFQLAIDDYSQAIERAPANAAYRISRAACYSQLQHWTEAESDYEEAIGLADNDASVWRSRGDYFISRGEWSRAAQDYESAIERAPENAELWNGAAVIARKLNKSEWHNELCREFAGKLGDRKVAGDIQSVIWVCCRFRSVTNVKELLNDVVAKWPANEKEDGLGSFSRGVFQYRSGDWQAAELSLQKSIDETQAPANFRGLCFLAMSQAMLEQLDRAQETFERAKELLDEIIRSREKEKETSPPSRWVEEFECDELYDEVRQTIEAQGGRLR